MMNVQDLMTGEVQTCLPEDALNDAARLMWDNDCGCIVVVDQQDRVLGILTDRDICMAAYTQGRELASIPVSAAMSREPHCCPACARPAEVQHIMQSYRVRRVPVVDDDNRLIGIVSLADVGRWISLGASSGAEGVTWQALGRTLAAVCAPRAFTPPVLDNDPEDLDADNQRLHNDRRHATCTG